MTTAAAAKKPTRSFREREHRMSKLPMKDLLRARMEELELKNIDLQLALDYPQPNVIAMMKMGSMKMPASKAVDVARALKMDPAFILSKLLNENEPALWDTIQKVMGNRIVSEAEMGLITFIRGELEGFELDFTKSEPFINGIKAVLAPIKEELMNQHAKHLRSIDAAAAARKSPVEP